MFGLILAFGLCSLATATDRYYSDLMFNHSSPWYPPQGSHEISRVQAAGVDHYAFTYDVQNRLIRITNNFRRRTSVHPLTHPGVVKTMEISYRGNVETREFLDTYGNPAINAKWVYKERYTYDDQHELKRLDFLDLEDQPMESTWLIARYEWTKVGNLIVERRYNLENTPMDIAPYFRFGTITGLVPDAQGRPKATISLDEGLKPREGLLHVSSYTDVYNDQNNHIEFDYRDLEGNLTLSPFGFAVGKRYYNDQGYLVKEELFNLNKEVISTADY